MKSWNQQLDELQCKIDEAHRRRRIRTEIIKASKRWRCRGDAFLTMRELSWHILKQ